MNYIDLIIILVLIMATYIGYKNGLFRKLYNLMIILISIVLSFIFQYSVGTIVFNLFSNHELLQNELFILFKDKIINLIGFFIAYLVIYIILKIIVYILVRRKILSNDKERFKILGSIINVIETLVIISVVGFLLSFATYININHYEETLLLKLIYRINIPLYSYGEKTKTIMDNFISISRKINEFQMEPNKLLADEETIETIKLLFETEVIDEDIVVQGSKILLKDIEQQNIDFSKINFEEVKGSEEFNNFKKLYDEDIITENILRRIVEENNLIGFDIDGLIRTLEEKR